MIRSDTRDAAETRQLYAWIAPREEAFKDAAWTTALEVFSDVTRSLPDDIKMRFADAIAQLSRQEAYIWPAPPPDFQRMDLKDFVAYRALLSRKQYAYQNQDYILGLFRDGLYNNLRQLSEALPETQTPSPFTIPLIYTLPSPQLAILNIYLSNVEKVYRERGLFRDVANRLYENLCDASGLNPTADNIRKQMKCLTTSTLPPSQLAHAYLKGTPYLDLFNTPVPLKLTHEERFNHMHIVGGTGAGKTTLIERLILHDLQSPDPPSLVIVDPHGDLIRKLTRADLGLGDRLIIIDPRDIKHPPALNVFAVNKERMRSYDEATREQVTSGVIQTFDYLFSGLFGMDLTGKQQVFFRYVTRLMLSLPEIGVMEKGSIVRRNATILDMLHLMQDATPYLPAIRSLPPIQRDFFEHDFLDPKNTTFKQTRDQIRYRLQAIVGEPSLERLFTAPETKIDLFTEMGRGAVIIVDTAKDFLKGASSTYGRLIISQVLQAILERAAIPERERKPTFLIVDEAASYFDSNIDDLLTDVRKYKCGCVFAHQYLDQASSSLRASLSANTGIKFASGLSASDARSMAPDMRSTADFILNQPRLQFAAHIRNVTPHAVSIPVALGAFDTVPQLSASAYQAMMERNRQRVSLQPTLSQPQRTLQFTSPQGFGEPEPDISPKW